MTMSAPPEPIHDIAHLGRVEILTPKPDKSLWYFREILGMEVVHLQGPSVFFAATVTAPPPPSS